LPKADHKFRVQAAFEPSGDQPAAIAGLVDGLEGGERFQTLRGITGSGKTATIAWTIEAVQRPTLILEPNKSLAAQLASELREMLPDNRVEFFVSYYDYYQPEAYLPSSDTFIEKDSSINDEIDRLRHAATSSLLLRPDVVIVASVSAIYGLGSPEEYRARMLPIAVGDVIEQRGFLARLIELQYHRNDMNLERGNFRLRGDTLEIHPAYEATALRIEFFGDTVERISPYDPLTGNTGEPLDEVVIFASTHYGASAEGMREAIVGIEDELREQLQRFTAEGKLLEAQRLRSRTDHDLEMLQEIGVCSGIENYSRHLDGRAPGEAPYTLLDYFPEDFLVVIDESHVAVPQIRGQYAGDKSRKTTLVEHGFRLPSAMDNRPLTAEEFYERINQVVFVSATPGPFELEESSTVVEQIIRPTGLLDPEVRVVPTKGQIDDLQERIAAKTAAGFRTLVTTLTKKMAEDLTEYLAEHGHKVTYLHSDIDTIARVEILRDLRLGVVDVLVGINLLREGLDLPEVALVAILDADKEGFLRSASALIQTMGRAARNSEGEVVLYADHITNSMRLAIGETQRRRETQIKYNAERGIVPATVQKEVLNILSRLMNAGSAQSADAKRPRSTLPVGASKRIEKPLDSVDLTGLDADARELLEGLRSAMELAAADLRFEEAAALRDELASLQLLFRSGNSATMLPSDN